MRKAVELLLIGLMVLLVINGIRLTFFPLRACDIVRDNQIPSLEHSVMEFHKQYGETPNEP